VQAAGTSGAVASHPTRRDVLLSKGLSRSYPASFLGSGGVVRGRQYPIVGCSGCFAYGYPRWRERWPRTGSMRSASPPPASSPRIAIASRMSGYWGGIKVLTVQLTGLLRRHAPGMAHRRRSACDHSAAYVSTFTVRPEAPARLLAGGVHLAPARSIGLVIRLCGSSRRVAVVDRQRVAVWILEESLTAHARVDRLALELDAA
jgi:hypothetical protein